MMHHNHKSWSIVVLLSITRMIALFGTSPNGVAGFSTPNNGHLRRFGNKLEAAVTTTTTTTTTTTEQQQEQEQEEASNGKVMIPLNPLVANVKVSKTVEVFGLVKQMEAEGLEVTSLCVGEPDFDPPPSVLEATKKAITEGKTRYTAVTGTLELRQAIANDLQKRKGIKYDAQTEIVVGNGAKQSVYQGVLALVGMGDAVIVPAPYWPSYPEMVRLAGAEPVILQTKAEEGFLLTPEGLRATLEATPNAKLLILCNPSNPTGGVHSQERLEELADVLRDFPNVAVLADEIYEQLVYKSDDDDNDDDDAAAASCPAFASIPDMMDRTLTMNGFSKAYAMTGYRLGYVAAPAHFAKACTTIQSQLTSCAGSLSQAAGVAALTHVSEEWLEQNRRKMQEKRDYVLNRLEKMEGVTVLVPPKGAFYVLPDVSGFYQGNDTELCLQLLKSKRLALVPGSSFGAPGTVRISYATSMEELQIAMDKLQDFLMELKEDDDDES